MGIVDFTQVLSTFLKQFYRRLVGFVADLGGDAPGHWEVPPLLVGTTPLAQISCVQAWAPLSFFFVFPPQEANSRVPRALW